MRHAVARSRVLALPLALLGAAGPGGAQAHEAEGALRRVSFQVSRFREVPNDLVRATLGVSDEDADPVALADRVNRALAWGLERARKQPDVRVESGGYQTFPVHAERGRIRGWRASHSLTLEGRDAELVSRLAGELQSRLQLQGLQFSVSPEREQAVEEELVVESLAAFKARAELVRENLGARSYEIVSVSFQAGGGVPRPVHARGYATAEMAGGVAAPELEPGTSRVTVGLSATIELD